MYRIDRLYRHLEFSLALPLVVTKLTRIATYAFFLIHWVRLVFGGRLSFGSFGGGCLFWGGRGVYVGVSEQGAVQGWMGRGSRGSSSMLWVIAYVCVEGLIVQF